MGNRESEKVVLKQVNVKKLRHDLREVTSWFKNAYLGQYHDPEHKEDYDIAFNGAIERMEKIIKSLDET